MTIKILFASILAAAAFTSQAAPAQAFDFSGCHFEERCREICTTATDCDVVCFSTLVCDDDEGGGGDGSGGFDDKCLGLTGNALKRCLLAP